MMRNKKDDDNVGESNIYNHGYMLMLGERKEWYCLEFPESEILNLQQPCFYTTLHGGTII